MLTYRLLSILWYFHTWALLVLKIQLYVNWLELDQPEYVIVKHATWRHLLLLPYGVIPGELNPLVGLDTRHAQELHTLHTVTCGLCVVITAHAHLKWKDKVMCGYE